jgi:hypothetical protein
MGFVVFVVFPARASYVQVVSVPDPVDCNEEVEP